MWKLQHLISNNEKTKITNVVDVEVTASNLYQNATHTHMCVCVCVHVCVYIYVFQAVLA